MYKIVNFDYTPKPVYERACDGCTSCCEGWLSANIYGTTMAPKIPCTFLSKEQGCSIYNNRPFNPCQVFYCHWKSNLDVPEHFKPSISKNIMVYRKHTNGLYSLDIVEAGKPISLEILNWAMVQFRKKKVDSVRWFMEYNTKINYISRDEKFIDLMDSVLNENDAT